MSVFAQIPRTALWLGLAGLLPFLWGVGTLWSEMLYALTMDTIGARFVGPYVLLAYGTIILAFMSGVLWGFAAGAKGTVQATGLALSVLPALWAFFFVGGGAMAAAGNLIAGFVGVLAIDVLFWRQGLTPSWWLALRIPLTGIVCLCLAVVALG